MFLQQGRGRRAWVCPNLFTRLWLWTASWIYIGLKTGFRNHSTDNLDCGSYEFRPLWCVLLLHYLCNLFVAKTVSGWENFLYIYLQPLATALAVCNFASLLIYWSCTGFCSKSVGKLLAGGRQFFYLPPFSNRYKCMVASGAAANFLVASCNSLAGGHARMVNF